MSVVILGQDLSPQSSTVNCEVTFKCPTPAWIKAIQFRALICDKGDFPPAESKLPTPLGFKPMSLTEDYVEGFSIHIEGKGGSYRMSRTTLDQLESGEVVILLIARVLFSDIYGDRDFMSSSIGQVSPLLNMNGTYTKYWTNGPEHLNWDKQVD